MVVDESPGGHLVRAYQAAGKPDLFDQFQAGRLIVQKTVGSPFAGITVKVVGPGGASGPGPGFEDGEPGFDSTLPAGFPEQTV